MASTWSALKIELLETGANSGTWGTATNVNLGDAILGEAITGSATVNFATDADVTVTLTDSATSQSARNLRLNITESSTGIGSVRNLILGSGCQIEKFYLVNNTGTGAKTIKNTTGTGISVPAGKATLVYNDGTNVVDGASYFTSLTLGSALPVASGGTGLTAGTSGGIPAYTASGTLTSSGVLAQYGVVIGGGAGAVPTSTAVGTATHVLTSNGSGVAPTFQALPAGGVTTFTAGTTGFTPSTATSGAVTLAGTLAVANGGTGQTSYTNGQLLIGNTTGNTLTKATLTAGTGVTVTNSTGSITVTNSGVTSNVAGTGISVSGATGAVTVTNSGVTSIVAGTGISVSGATGAVTVSASGGGFSAMTVYTSSSTFTIPTGKTTLKITVVGGGGGGAAGHDYGTGGGGGGGGGASIAYFTSVTPGNTLTVTIGAGGTRGAAGSGAGGGLGGTTSVASGTQTITTISATGGEGGPYTSTQGSSGGLGSGGNINLGGSAGLPSLSGGICGGCGGSSFMGGGGKAISAAAGEAGRAYGGGGASGSGNGGGSGLAGGLGSAGVVMIEY